MVKPQTDPRPKKLLEQVHDTICLKHYSPKTGESYANWIRRFILFHDKRHPNDVGAPEIEAFLKHLAVKKHVAASTQNQALSALLFLYREVLRKDIGLVYTNVSAQKPEHLPTVLTKDKVRTVLNLMEGTPQLMAQLLYGSGMRLMECMQLRVKDLDFAQRQIIIHDAKGQKDG